MPVSVPLDFVAPDEPSLVKLLIYESTTSDGTFDQIEEVTNIGTYPNYIREYTTDNATSATDWFAIEWEDDKGARTGLSAPIQGGTTTVVGEIVDRVLLRDPHVNDIVAAQEASAVVERFYGVDPYSPDITPTWSELSALTYLTLSRVYIGEIVSTTAGESYSAGLVSQKSSTSTQDHANSIKWLIDQANKILGAEVVVMLLEDIDPTGIGVVSGINFDASRGIMTEYLS